MANRNPELQSKEYDAIRKEYNALKAKKKLGVQFYSNKYIIKKVADKFFKSPVTIENILYRKI